MEENIVGQGDKTKGGVSEIDIVKERYVVRNKIQIKEAKPDVYLGGKVPGKGNGKCKGP